MTNRDEKKCDRIGESRRSRNPDPQNASADREILNPRRRARRSPLAQTETTRSGNPQIEKSWMIGLARRRRRRSPSPGPTTGSRNPQIKESPDQENLGERRAPRRQRAKTRRGGQDRGAGDRADTNGTRGPLQKTEDDHDEQGRPRRARNRDEAQGAQKGKAPGKGRCSPRAARKRGEKRPQIKKKKKGYTIAKD